MAGTDYRRPTLSGGPAIILVEPQLGENIGTAARAMLNCGLTDLRLVKPRDGWPSEKARGGGERRRSRCSTGRSSSTRSRRRSPICSTSTRRRRATATWSSAW